MIYRFLSFLPLTILMCTLYQKRKNPILSMVGHTLIDIATVVEILMTSAMPSLYGMMQSMV